MSEELIFEDVSPKVPVRDLDAALDCTVGWASPFTHLKECEWSKRQVRPEFLPRRWPLEEYDEIW
jgi:hypothetical protein